MRTYMYVVASQESPCKWRCSWYCTWKLVRRVRLTSEWVSEWWSDWASERASDWVSEWASKRVSEWLSEWKSDWVSEQVSDWVIEWVSEWASERVIQWMSDWVSKSVSHTVGRFVRELVAGRMEGRITFLRNVDTNWPLNTISLSFVLTAVITSNLNAANIWIKVTNFSKLYTSCYTVVPNTCLIGFPGEKKKKKWSEDCAKHKLYWTDTHQNHWLIIMWISNAKFRGDSCTSFEN